MDEGASPEAGSEQVFPLSEGQFFGLGNFLNELEAQDRTLSPTVMDMGRYAAFNMFKLSLSDVLSLAPQDSLYQLQLTGDMNDPLVLTPGEWSRTYHVLNHG